MNKFQLLQIYPIKAVQIFIMALAKFRVGFYISDIFCWLDIVTVPLFIVEKIAIEMK